MYNKYTRVGYLNTFQRTEEYADISHVFHLVVDSNELNISIIA